MGKPIFCFYIENCGGVVGSVVGARIGLPQVARRGLCISSVTRGVKGEFCVNTFPRSGDLGLYRSLIAWPARLFIPKLSTDVKSTFHTSHTLLTWGNVKRCR